MLLEAIYLLKKAGSVWLDWKGTSAKDPDLKEEAKEVIDELLEDGYFGRSLDAGQDVMKSSW